MAKIKRGQGNVEEQGPGEILPVNPLDYQSEKYANETPRKKGIFSMEHVTPQNDPH